MDSLVSSLQRATLLSKPQAASLAWLGPQQRAICCCKRSSRYRTRLLLNATAAALLYRYVPNAILLRRMTKGLRAVGLRNECIDAGRVTLQCMPHSAASVLCRRPNSQLQHPRTSGDISYVRGKVSRSPSRYMLRRCQPARQRYCSPGSMLAAFRTCLLGILVFSGCSQGLQLPFGLSSWLQTGWQHHHHHCKPYHVRPSHAPGSLVVQSCIASRSRRPIPPISTQYCDRPVPSALLFVA